jgi:S-disulfanyl-L-cysteine oxidoreductase SoxD
MSTCSAVVGVVLLTVSLTCAEAAQQDGPGLGEAVDAATLRRIDLTVLPDGSGLPAGSGSVAAGEAVYVRHCLACHGAEGRGAPNDALVGGVGSLASDRPLKTLGSFWPYATTVFDYIRRSMPYQAPGTLSDDEVYAVTAYLLHENGIVDAEAVLDADGLPRVQMPNREGFRDALAR